jgi:hypothetical protein
MLEQAALAKVIAARDAAAKWLHKKPSREYSAKRQALENQITAKQAEWQSSAAYRRHAAEIAKLQSELDALPAPAEVTRALSASAEAGTLLEALKAAFRKDREVEPGPLRLVVAETPSVGWEKVHNELAGVAAVAKALLDPAAVLILKQARAKDPTASFTTVAIKSFDVEPDPNFEPA